MSEVPKGVSEEVYISAVARGDDKSTRIEADSWQQACRWAELLVEHQMVRACVAIRKAEHNTPHQHDLIIHSRTFYS